mgnify:CR=1 FL=1
MSPCIRGGLPWTRTKRAQDLPSRFTSVRCTERLDEIGAGPSVGTVADSFHKALAATTNGLHDAERVCGPDTPAVWDDVDQLELETLGWVLWFNEDRFHGHCDDVPPAEVEAAFHAARQTDLPGLETNGPSLHQTRAIQVVRLDNQLSGDSGFEWCGSGATADRVHRGSMEVNSAGSLEHHLIERPTLLRATKLRVVLPPQVAIG